MDSPPRHRAPAEPSGEVGFTQVGALDWVSFSKSSVTMSIEVLARLESSGVQAITYSGALHMAHAFTISEKGRARVVEALGRLGVESAFQNVLYFGFGHRSLLRHLSDSVAGLKCIALCACLAEMHSEVISARILASLWKLSGYPEAIEPSITQFKSLIRACAGAVSKSVFSEMGQRMIGNPKTGLCSDPKDIATVLLALFELSLGTRDQVVVTGNQECAFIAAFSYWIFDFSILVEDRDGHPLFMSFPHQKDRRPQVHIVFSPAGNRALIQITSSVFALRDPTELIQTISQDRGLFRLRYRIAWPHCLETAFGEDFKDLVPHSELIGHSLGAAARIYLGMARGDPDVCNFCRLTFIDFNENSYGMGFLESVGTIFPELRTDAILRAMQAMVLRQVSACCSTLRDSIFEIQKICRCTDCGRGDYPRVPAPKDRPYCLTALTFTLIDLVQSVSSVERTSTELLQPTMYGLHRFYRRKLTAWESQSCSEDLKLAGLLGLSENPARQEDAQDDRMSWLVELFAGTPIKNTYDFGENSECLTAIAINGVCVYQEILASATWRAEHLRCFHVVPGFISHANSTYNSIHDPATVPVADLQKVEVVENDGDDSHRSLTKSSEKLNFAGFVEESEIPGQLAFWYRVSPLEGESVTLPPGSFAQFMLQRTGLVPCSRADCSTELFQPCRFTKKGWPPNHTLPDDQREFFQTLCSATPRRWTRTDVGSAHGIADGKQYIMDDSPYERCRSRRS